MVTDCDDDGLFSPQFTSMHPAGGEEVVNENGVRTWVPNKDGWPAPDGNQTPPDFNPLAQLLHEYCKTDIKLLHFHTFVANMVAIHRCNGYRYFHLVLGLLLMN